MSRKRLRELQRKLDQGFKDKFPCLPEFFSWSSSTVDLTSVDKKALAMEINRFLVEKAKRNEFVKADVPFTVDSKVAGGEIEVKALSRTIRELQEELERLVRNTASPGIPNN